MHTKLLTARITESYYEKHNYKSISRGRERITIDPTTNNMFEKRDRESVPVRAGKSVMAAARSFDPFVKKWWDPLQAKLSEADESV